MKLNVNILTDEHKIFSSRCRYSRQIKSQLNVIEEANYIIVVLEPHISMTADYLREC